MLDSDGGCVHVRGGCVGLGGGGLFVVCSGGGRGVGFRSGVVGEGGMWILVGGVCGFRWGEGIWVQVGDMWVQVGWGLFKAGVCRWGGLVRWRGEVYGFRWGGGYVCSSGGYVGSGGGGSCSEGEGCSDGEVFMWGVWV